MREIKFRAWDKKTNKWMFGYDYPNLGGFSITGEVVLMGEFEKAFSPLDRLDDIEIMQYTGLKDKNGIAIYEGDIVKANGNADGKIVFLNGAFVWTDGCCYWQLCNDEKRIFYGAKGRDCEDMEVIGNIYENPELLK